MDYIKYVRHIALQPNYGGYVVLKINSFNQKVSMKIISGIYS